ASSSATPRHDILFKGRPGVLSHSYETNHRAKTFYSLSYIPHGVIAERSQVCFDGLSQPHLQCVRNKGVADGNLQQPWNALRKEWQIVQIKIVPGVQSK